MSFYKCCAVPLCKSTSISTPQKLFIHVPKSAQVRRKWLTLARRHPASLTTTSTSYFCEDHFIQSETREFEPSRDTNISITRTRACCKQSAVPTTDKSQKDDLLIESIKANKSQTCEYNNTGSRTNKRRRKQTADVKLPEAEEIIGRVYKFLQAEYEFLKCSIGDICDLSPLTNVLKRTADACGVRECTVRHVVRKTRPQRDLNVAGEGSERAGGEFTCGDSEIEGQDSSNIEEELDTTDSVEETEDINEQADNDSEERAEYEVEAPNMEVDYYEVKPLDPLKTELVEIKTEFADSNPYSITKENSRSGILDIELTGDQGEKRVQFDCEVAVEVKTESTDELYSHRSSSGVTLVTSLATVKTEPDETPPHSNVLCTSDVIGDTTSYDVKCEPPEP